MYWICCCFKTVQTHPSAPTRQGTRLLGPIPAAAARCRQPADAFTQLNFLWFQFISCCRFHTLHSVPCWRKSCLYSSGSETFGPSGRFVLWKLTATPKGFGYVHYRSIGIDSIMNLSEYMLNHLKAIINPLFVHINDLFFFNFFMKSSYIFQSQKQVVRNMALFYIFANLFNLGLNISLILNSWFSHPLLHSLCYNMLFQFEYVKRKISHLIQIWVWKREHFFIAFSYNGGYSSLKPPQK